MRKAFSLALIVILAVSSLTLFGFASSQTIPKPSVPEFTIEIVSLPYDVPPTTSTTIDQYTGKQTTTTQPGYHVENKTFEAVIKNSLGVSFYNFRYKGHYGDSWSYEPFNPNASLPYFLSDSYGVPFQASTSDYSVLTLYFLPTSISPGGQVDIQVQALYGNFDAVPYGHVMQLPGGPTYDFYFKGETGDWSNTKTISIGEDSASISSNPTPSPTNTAVSPTLAPTVPEFSWLAFLPLFAAMLFVAVKLRHRKSLCTFTQVS